MKHEIAKNGLSKSVTQAKNKLRNMKGAYKKAKDNITQTGASLAYPTVYNKFDEMLGSRDVINPKYVKEVEKGLSSANYGDVEKSLQPGSPILKLGKWNIFLSGTVYYPH